MDLLRLLIGSHDPQLQAFAREDRVGVAVDDAGHQPESGTVGVEALGSAGGVPSDLDNRPSLDHDVEVLTEATASVEDVQVAQHEGAAESEGRRRGQSPVSEAAARISAAPRLTSAYRPMLVDG